MSAVMFKDNISSRLVPAAASFLLRCFYMGSVTLDASVHVDTLRWARDNGLVELDELGEDVSVDQVRDDIEFTRRGRLYIEMMLRTPIPVPVYTDPRTEQVVEHLLEV